MLWTIRKPDYIWFISTLWISSLAWIWLIDFYFRLHLVFSLLSIHLLQYKERGQSWEWSIDIKKVTFLDLYCINGSPWFQNLNLQLDRILVQSLLLKDCKDTYNGSGFLALSPWMPFFCFISKPCVLLLTFQQNFLNSWIYINP